MKLPVLHDPWDIVDPQESDAVVQELARELGPQHALKGKKVRAVARRCDCDDVLFTIIEEERCAVVHLTFQGKEETDPRWPATEFYSSVAEWVERCMLPDHRDYVSV